MSNELRTTPMEFAHDSSLITHHFFSFLVLAALLLELLDQAHGVVAGDERQVFVG